MVSGFEVIPHEQPDAPGGSEASALLDVPNSPAPNTSATTPKTTAKRCSLRVLTLPATAHLAQKQRAQFDAASCRYPRAGTPKRAADMAARGRGSSSLEDGAAPGHELGHVHADGPGLAGGSAHSFRQCPGVDALRRRTRYVKRPAVAVSCSLATFYGPAKGGGGQPLPMTPAPFALSGVCQ